jgi:hypothetical protein
MHHGMQTISSNRHAPHRDDGGTMGGQCRSAAARTPHVLKDPAPSISVSHLGCLAVTIAIEPWIAVVHYASVHGEINKAVIE